MFQKCVKTIFFGRHILIHGENNHWATACNIPNLVPTHLQRSRGVILGNRDYQIKFQIQNNSNSELFSQMFFVMFKN